MNPIIRRDVIDALRTRKAIASQLGLAALCAILVLLRWPTGEVADLSGGRALEVLRMFGYGLLAGVFLLTPAFPAVSLVRERVKGTLALLLNTPMSAPAIYLGKLGGVLGFMAVLLIMTFPAAAACYALGGAGSQVGILALYGVLALASLQFATLGLLISSRSQSTDSALRFTYALVLVVSVMTLGPHVLLQGGTGLLPEAASWLRCLSPLPPVMEILGQGDLGSQGIGGGAGTIGRYALLSLAFSLCCAGATVLHLNQSILDRARPAGVMTQDRTTAAQVFRRLFFLVDPQRRSRSMSLLVNPVMVKEFRSRRFGRGHWMIRLIAVCAIFSLSLSYISASGALGWGVEIIGAALVILQIALLILFAPSLGAGLISSERESGSWQLLRMTPLTAGVILRGKLLSVAWPLLVLLSATLPGYIVMMTVKPELVHQVQRVVICLALTAVFAVLVSASLSTFFRSTAAATTASYLVLLMIFVGTLLIWLGRDAPFGHSTVAAFLVVNPVATALQASETPGFASYQLLPANWWIISTACVALVLLLCVRVWQLSRPE